MQTVSVLILVSVLAHQCLLGQSFALQSTRMRSKLGRSSALFQPTSSVTLTTNNQHESSSKTSLNSIAAIATTLTSLPQAYKIGIAASSFLAFIFGLNKVLWIPSRAYDREANSVGREYDAWEEEGILEHYWGEHIHLGYYTNDVIRSSDVFPPKKNFIQAKYDFIDEMLKFGKFDTDSKPAKILDVGCGIGGTSRYLARKLGQDTEVTGITLSPSQVRRATELAKEQETPNAKFQVMDALEMQFPDNTFDYVWACESGEHMPDKKKYVEEMTRVLKPGGRIVIVTSFDQSVSEGLRRLLCLAPCVALRRISAPEPTSVLSNMMRYFTPYQPVASFGQPKHVCELPARQAATERLSRDARKASTSESKTDHIVRWVHTR
jgi:ubiquinone/menaquinone biosynthesis C-methylase UbiE